MNYEVIATPNFKREVKKLAKKYLSLKSDFAQLVESLQNNPTQGASLGNNCYKIRMAVKSKGKGKSGGSRVISYVRISQTKIYLLSIFDKSDKENITNKELKEWLKEIED